MSAEEELAALEARTLRAGGIAKLAYDTDVLRTLLAAGADSVKAIVLAMTLAPIEAQAMASLLDAYAIGAADAARIAGLDPADFRRARAPKAALDVVRGLDAEGRDALRRSQTLARAQITDDAAVLAPLLGYANKVKARVGDAINVGGNEAVRTVADAAELPLVWVAETNACVTCLAYSGRVTSADGTFPAGLTYGRRSTVGMRLRTPPAHPHCRCTLEPLNDPSYAEALRREADRSVLRGFSLQSESMSVRVDAAERLLAQPGLVAPKSVQAYAQRAVKAGAFPRRGR